MRFRSLATALLLAGASGCGGGRGSGRDAAIDQGTGGNGGDAGGMGGGAAGGGGTGGGAGSGADGGDGADGAADDGGAACDAPGEGTPADKPAGDGVLKGYIYANSDIYLFRIATSTLIAGAPVVEKVGEFGVVPDRMTDLAVTPDDHIYGISWMDGAPPNKLWEIDPDTAKPTYIADIPGSSNVALTFDVDGTLIGVDKGGGVRRIDPKTGMTSDVGSWGMGFGAAGDIVGLMDGALYGIADSGGSASETNNALVKFDVMTGAATEVGLIGYDNLWGAAFWCGKFYAFSADAYVVEIDAMTGKGKKVTGTIAEAKSGFYGAGVTPNAPLGTTVGTGCKP